MHQKPSVRSPDIVVGGLRFYRDSSSFIYLFFRQLRKSTETGRMLGSECNFETYVRNVGYLLSLQIGIQKLAIFDDFTT